MSLDPEQCAIAARRLAAKMVADQAVPLMVSYIGMVGDPAEASVVDALDDEDVAMVLVARGQAKWKIAELIYQKPPQSIEAEQLTDDDLTRIEALRSVSQQRSPAGFLFRGRNVHTVWSPLAQSWGNRREAASDSFHYAKNLAEALRIGRETARAERVEHIVHDRQGRVIDRERFD